MDFVQLNEKQKEGPAQAIENGDEMEYIDPDD